MLMLIAVLVVGMSAVLAACGGTTTTTAAPAGTTQTSAASTETTAAPTTGTSGTTATSGAASGEPIRFGFDEGFTGFMAYDCQLADQGVKTALAMLNNQWEGRPLEYFAEDNTSDPVVAVDKARKLVESDKINVMIGPIFSPSAKSVADYLGKSSGIPEMSIVGQPTENLETANGLAFIQTGFFDSHGYYFGKYLAEKGYKTANVINYDDTPAYALTAGFKKAFVDEGGGQILSENYIPLDVVDFSSYLSAMKPADVTVNWIFGNGAVPFVKQFKDYGVKGALAVADVEQLQRRAAGGTRRHLPGHDRLRLLRVDRRQPDEQGLHRGVRQAVQRRETHPAGLRCVAGRHALPRRAESHGRRHRPEEGHPRDVQPDHGLARPASSRSSPSRTRSSRKRDFFILEVQKVDDVLTWVPVKTYNQVLLGDLASMGK